MSTVDNFRALGAEAGRVLGESITVPFKLSPAKRSRYAEFASSIASDWIGSECSRMRGEGVGEDRISEFRRSASETFNAAVAAALEEAEGVRFLN